MNAKPPRAAGWLLALALLALPACRRETPPPPAPTVVRYEPALTVREARQKNLQTVQTYLATVRGDTEMDLSFKVGGILEQIGQIRGQDWQEGVKVEAGTPLAILKQSEFTNRLESARAKAELDASLLRRGEKLMEDKAISDQELEVLKANARASRSASDQARQDAVDSRLVAPFTGVILARRVNSGETVQPGQTVLRFGDMQRVSVELGVPDRIVSRVQKGARVPLIVTSLEGRLYEGEINEVGAAAQEGSRLYKVVVKVDNADGAIKSGMTASVSFPEADPRNLDTLLVPLSALVAASRQLAGPTNTGALAVFVVGPDNRAQERKVETGEIIRSSVEILSGLRPREKVITVGASMLADGESIDARPVEPSHKP